MTLYVVEDVHSLVLRSDVDDRCDLRNRTWITRRIQKGSRKAIAGAIPKRWKGRVNDAKVRMDHQGYEAGYSLLCSG